jgi:hypothetical protein
MKQLLMSVALAFGVMTASSAHAVIVFQDNFDGEPGGSVLNYNSYANWDVTFGTVDKIANGGFGITCAGNTGQCVDIDGSTNDAGLMTLKQTFSFNAGDTVTLMFDYTGNQRATQSETIGITFAPFFSSFIAIGSGNIGLPFTTYSNSVVVNTAVTGVTLSIGQVAGTDLNDNVGPIIDNVVIDVQPGRVTPTVPLPAPALLLGGLVALGVWKARRTQA